MPHLFQNHNKSNIVIVIKACAVIYVIKTSTTKSLHHQTSNLVIFCVQSKQTSVNNRIIFIHSDASVGDPMYPLNTTPNVTHLQQQQKNKGMCTCCRQCGFMPCTFFPAVKKVNTFFTQTYPSDICTTFFFCPIYLLSAHSYKASKSIEQAACSYLL